MSELKLGTDSGDYDLLREAVQLSPSGYFLAAEIGVREGGSSQMIMEELSAKRFRGLYVMIDHYGGMPQWHADGQLVILDYTNEMRNKAMSALYHIANELKVNFQFFNLSDEDFFQHFSEGLPIYSGSVRLLADKYSFVHLDGPHETELVLTETAWFNERMVSGGIVVVDDINNINVEKYEAQIATWGLSLVKKGPHKAIYRKV